MRPGRILLGLSLVFGVPAALPVGSRPVLSPPDPRPTHSAYSRLRSPAPNPGVPAPAFEASGDGALRARTGAGYGIALTAGAVHLQTRAAAGGLAMSLVGARAVAPRGDGVLPGVVSVLRGADPAAWRTGLSRFERARFVDAYPGIDWVFRLDEGRVAYDFVVAPHADPGRIHLRVRGAAALALDDDGALHMSTGSGELVHAAPVIYQEGRAGREPVDGGFVIDAAAGEIGFRLGAYDVERELVIDPAIGFSSYLGGMASEDLPRIALTGGGSVIMVGTTSSLDLPTTAADGTPVGDAPAGDLDVFVARFAADGATLQFLTYLGGTGMDRAGGVAVAPDGSLWISGQTASEDLPRIEGAALAGPADAFVTRVSADGTEVTATHLIGGSGVESGTGVAVDGAGYVYLTGTTGSPDQAAVSATQDTLAGPSDALVARIDPSGRELVYATYLGGAGDDAGFAIAVDAAGSAYVTGSTASADFPSLLPAQPSFGGGGDAFVAKLTASGTLAWSTTLGGSAADVGLSIAVDAAGSAYVTGQTESADFPTRNPVQQLPGGGPDAFVTKLAADGATIEYSTFLGGSGVDVGGGIAVDGAGNAHVTGMTSSPDFPVEQSLQPYFGGGGDVFVARINDLGSALTYSTYSGGGGADAGIGIAVDGAGNSYVVGQTGSQDFPTFNPVQPALQGPRDAFITKYCLSLVFPDERQLASPAGSETFAVTTPAGCVWIAFSETPWITLTTPNVVAGPGEVQFDVLPNASGHPRAGTLNIAGARVIVTQGAATDCEYEISPGSENFYMVGGVGRIDIHTRDDCAWTASTTETWISISGADKGTGSGVVSYTVESNRTGRQRSGTIVVAGQTFVVFDWLR